VHTIPGVSIRHSPRQAAAHHGNGSSPASALESGRAREPKVVAWIREHGGAHNMAVLSKNKLAARTTSVYTVQCGTCGVDLRVSSTHSLQGHVNFVAHRLCVALDSDDWPKR
jgi:hypothetical protein